MNGSYIAGMSEFNGCVAGIYDVFYESNTTLISRTAATSISKNPSNNFAAIYIMSTHLKQLIVTYMINFYKHIYIYIYIYHIIQYYHFNPGTP